MQNSFCCNLIGQNKLSPTRNFPIDSMLIHSCLLYHNILLNRDFFIEFQRSPSQHVLSFRYIIEISSLPYIPVNVPFRKIGKYLDTRGKLSTYSKIKSVFFVITPKILLSYFGGVRIFNCLLYV